MVDELTVESKLVDY